MRIAFLQTVGVGNPFDGRLVEAFKDGRVEHFGREKLERLHVLGAERSPLGRAGSGHVGRAKAVRLPGTRGHYGIGATLARTGCRAYSPMSEMAGHDACL